MKINMAFKNYKDEDEQKENMKIFESYMRGGIDDAQSHFIDIEEQTEETKRAIESLAKKGIAEQDINEFRPNEIIDREQVVCIISRSLVNKKGYIRPQEVEEYLTHYSDKEDISAWAQTEVAFAVKENLVDIPEDRMLFPKEELTRAEVAVMINKLFDKLY